MDKIIKWGIVGAGNIANKFAEAIKNVNEAQLTAVASQSMGKGAEFAKKHNITNVFTSYEEMASSELVDAVYIATAHPFHKPCAEIFLNAKKHVLCEKPLCVNASQAKQLKECATKNNVFLMEAMWTRFLPAINAACDIVNSGEIGELRGVKADFCYYCTCDDDPKIFENDMAGGSLLDVGVYGLNFAAVFLGDKVENIISLADIRMDVDCHTNILMKFENGAIADISSALDVNKSTTAYVYGTKGQISLPQFFGAQEVIVTTDDGEIHISKPSIGAGFEEEIIEACKCIRLNKHESDIMPLDESIRIMEQMDCIRKQIGLRYPFDV